MLERARRADARGRLRARVLTPGLGGGRREVTRVTFRAARRARPRAYIGERRVGGPSGRLCRPGPRRCPRRADRRRLPQRGRPAGGPARAAPGRAFPGRLRVRLIRACPSGVRPRDGAKGSRRPRTGDASRTKCRNVSSRPSLGPGPNWVQEPVATVRNVARFDLANHGAVAAPLPLAARVTQARPTGFGNDVPGELEQIGRAIYEPPVEPTLEQMPAVAVPSVEPLRVPTVQPLHSLGDVWRRRFDRRW